MTKIGILGYGNLGRGVECAIKQNEDMELTYVFTRRDPATVKILTDSAKVASVNDILNHKDEIDILIICGGSATDLPVQTPEYAKHFNVIDSFDTLFSENIPGSHPTLIRAIWPPSFALLSTFEK